MEQCDEERRDVTLLTVCMMERIVCLEGGEMHDSAEGRGKGLGHGRGCITDIVAFEESFPTALFRR